MTQFNARLIQSRDNAGKMKLTAVTLSHGNHRYQFFAQLMHDNNGNAILPQWILDNVLTHHRGSTFNVG